MGNQANHRTNMCLLYESNSCYESDYESICIVSNGKTCSVPLNILAVYFTHHMQPLCQIQTPSVKNERGVQIKSHVTDFE